MKCRIQKAHQSRAVTVENRVDGPDDLELAHSVQFYFFAVPLRRGSICSIGRATLRAAMKI
jgi:hypothetical protein